MELDVSKLIQERCNYLLGLPKDPDPMVKAIIEEGSDYCFLLTLESVFKTCQRKYKALNQYYVAAIFDMGELYAPSTNARFSLFVLSKVPPRMLKIGRYLENLKKQKTSRLESLTPCDTFPETHVQYCKAIETWINKAESVPTGTTYYEFNTVDYSLFDENMPYARRYTKRYIDFRYGNVKGNFLKLHQVAEVISPTPIEKVEGGFTLTKSCLSYPFSRAALKSGRVTKTAVKKGDIVVCRMGETKYLITEDLDDVYINMHMLIIRPRNILPEYLFIYLTSETGKMIQEVYSVGPILKMLVPAALSEFPVLIPDSQDEYVAIFQAISAGVDSVENLNKTIATLNKPVEGVQALLKEETIRKLKLLKNPTVKKIILADFDEVKRCYEVEAYKATLILAGSILEAFLIDWLSEINNVDYFRYNPSAPDNLVGYINAIKEIKKPSWMEEADKANTIREKRNIVHAKLCMKNTTEINAETCRMVIAYLEDIISTRFLFAFKK